MCDKNDKVFFTCRNWISADERGWRLFGESAGIVAFGARWLVGVSKTSHVRHQHNETSISQSGCNFAPGVTGAEKSVAKAGIGCPMRITAQPIMKLRIVSLTSPWLPLGLQL